MSEERRRRRRRQHGTPLLCRKLIKRVISTPSWLISSSSTPTPGTPSPLPISVTAPTLRFWSSFTAVAETQFCWQNCVREQLHTALMAVCGLLPFLRYFTYKEIKRATVGFSRIIRNGPYGAVYRAQFSDGLVSVVKKVAVSEQGEDAFHRELGFLGHLHHRHLIKLQGFSEERDRFLVFDYMENGSLKEFLHDPLRTPLNWRRRLQIAIDVAAALDYLYSFCDPPLYNVTISADNIMLDRNFVAKISLFESLSSDGCQVHGLNGENFRGHVDERNKNILFQFGVLILELVTGQSFGTEGKELMQWIQQSNITHSMHNMVDSDLGSTYSTKELKSLLTIARLCTKVGDEPVISISQVLRYLQRKMSLD